MTRTLSRCHRDERRMVIFALFSIPSNMRIERQYRTENTESIGSIGSRAKGDCVIRRKRGGADERLPVIICAVCEL